jgi:hypothetical protein
MNLVKISLGILLTAGIELVCHASLAAQTAPVLPSQPLQPSLPLPSNHTRATEALTASSCPTQAELVALVPVENPVLTTAEHPTFWFYVPAGVAQAGEFSLWAGAKDKTPLYQTRFTLPQQSGIVSLSLPSSPDYALQENTPYHWYFKLFCTDNSANNSTKNADSSDSLEVDGWVQRVALTPDRQLQLAADSPDLWYDSLAQVASGLLVKPENSILRGQWRILLRHIKAENLAQEPLIGPVQLQD